jgi:hypothetical protein
LSWNEPGADAALALVANPPREAAASKLAATAVIVPRIRDLMVSPRAKRADVNAATDGADDQLVPSERAVHARQPSHLSLPIRSPEERATTRELVHRWRILVSYGKTENRTDHLELVLAEVWALWSVGNTEGTIGRRRHNDGEMT